MCHKIFGNNNLHAVMTNKEAFFDYPEETYLACKSETLPALTEVIDQFSYHRYSVSDLECGDYGTITIKRDVGTLEQRQEVCEGIAKAINKAIGQRADGTSKAHILNSRTCFSKLR